MLSKTTKRNAIIAGVLGLTLGLLIRACDDSKKDSAYMPLHNWQHLAVFPNGDVTILDEY